MRKWLRPLLGLLFALAVIAPAAAQGTTPLALAQQQDQNGQPLAGCLLYFFVAGTVATPQNSYQDYGLSLANPNPLQCDQAGRVPMFWVANGLIHQRLTDAAGNVIVDNTMYALGPSTGSGGSSGPSIDPTTIAATGDIKFRLTSETLTGWIQLNGQTIGNASSGATQRANADTQNLFVYLWTNCAQPSSNNHCAVVGGIGSTALADYNANKQITLFDMRDKMLVGRDCMGNTCAGGLLALNVSSGGTDGVDTPAARGGVANQAIAQANFPNVNFTIPSGQGSHSHLFNVFDNPASGSPPASGYPGQVVYSGIIEGWATTNTAQNSVVVVTQTLPAMYAQSGGSGTALPVMNPFALGTWYQKL